MTNASPLGEAAVEHLVDDNMVNNRPQACGSYTVLPDDNSTLSKNCNMWGWNGTHADGKWTRSSGADGPYRIFQAARRDTDGYIFHSKPKLRNCDDVGANETFLSPGDTWAVFVR